MSAMGDYKIIRSSGNPKYMKALYDYLITHCINAHLLEVKSEDSLFPYYELIVPLSPNAEYKKPEMMCDKFDATHKDKL